MSLVSFTEVEEEEEDEMTTDFFPFEENLRISSTL